MFPIGKRPEWRDVWAALDKRRLPDGSFEPWKAPDLASQIELWRAAEWHSNGWMGKLAAVLLTPAGLVAKLAR
jgi:hypothetical protein